VGPRWCERAKQGLPGPLLLPHRPQFGVWREFSTVSLGISVNKRKKRGRGHLRRPPAQCAVDVPGLGNPQDIY
jgi:hypothetical protein